MTRNQRHTNLLTNNLNTDYDDLHQHYHLNIVPSSFPEPSVNRPMAISTVGDAVNPNRKLEERLLEWRLFYPVLIRWLLKIAMWLIFVGSVIMIFLYASPAMEGNFFDIFYATDTSFYGLVGSFLVMFGAPVLILALLAVIYTMAFPTEYHKTKKSKFLRFHLSTFPAFVNGPLGVVSAAELIGILVFAIYVVWAAYGYTIQNHRYISKFPHPAKEKRHLMLEYSGYRLGTIGMFFLTFLFIPVSRGSILLRIIDVPFEYAIRYHRWLGNATMTIFTMHSFCYILSWGLRGQLPHKLLRWNKHDVSYFPGLVSLVIGLLMWLTSLYPIRRRKFELFYYTHQLYAVFIFFFALHVGDFLFSASAGSIFLFMLDRFLRFCQSQTTVHIISVTSLPCGAVELVLSKPKNLHYNALSFIFLRVREISQLQWHPFSVSSSPLDGRNHLSVLIKGLGQWTSNLRDNILNAPEKIEERMQFQPLTASVEGPYGHQSPYYLKYEYLILIAGGIGITPFLAILSDILHRIKEKKPCLPKHILIVWAVKRSQELSLLSMVDAENICPSFSDNLHLEIQAFITQETGPQLEDGNLQLTMQHPKLHDANDKCISSLVATGNNIWSGVYVILPTVGFITLLTLLKAFYIKPYNITTWWFQGLLFLICMVTSVIVFGGVVVFLWRRWERKFLGYEKCMDGIDKSVQSQSNAPKSEIKTCQTTLLSSIAKKYGCRPNIQEIFNFVSKHWGNVDVGVIVCGPQSLNSSVAAECRSRNVWGQCNQPLFHFNSHSFEL
ncbi:ferric reduction oxidase 7, chloroplastic-like protein [Cinnamomum micranthum f. kanehirae]|uniref:Ferric reduction oxidase 7, chloroplastic-like protein n=1 Tax=Cinnamomum micranthum f. kanehirae TaxID=337451 RepID=A0A3S3N0S1_9MAGN|nr:ferric reduction oxidase 7, chloroplastic-like protein [Cinnamomum micranthum f. kanehirae]